MFWAWLLQLQPLCYKEPLDQCTEYKYKFQYEYNFSILCMSPITWPANTGAFPRSGRLSRRGGCIRKLPITKCHNTLVSEPFFLLVSNRGRALETKIPKSYSYFQVSFFYSGIFHLEFFGIIRNSYQRQT